MSEFVKKYEFKNPPNEISYLEGEPLKLSDSFIFYHNKNKFRKELNRLQIAFKNHTKTPLIASAIRDTYLKEEYTNKYLIIYFTTGEEIKNLNDVIESHANEEIKHGAFLLENTSSYMLLLAKDMEGLNLGIDTMEEIFQQTFSNYFSQNKLDDYIKIRPFKMR
jgi:hypothetical protein